MHFILGVSVGLFDMRSRNECNVSAVRVQCECCCWIIALSGEHNAAYARYAHRNSSRWSMGQLSQIAAASSLLLAAKVIRLSIDIDIDISGCDSPHAAYAQCAVKNRRAKKVGKAAGQAAQLTLCLCPH